MTKKQTQSKKKKKGKSQSTTSVSKSNAVDHPDHYTTTGWIEAIEYIESFLTEEEFRGYLRGNITKYLHRYRYKNGVEDLNKANWYLQRLIQLESKR